MRFVKLVSPMQSVVLIANIFTMFDFIDVIPFFSIMNEISRFYEIADFDENELLSLVE